MRQIYFFSSFSTFSRLAGAGQTMSWPPIRGELDFHTADKPFLLSRNFMRD